MKALTVSDRRALSRALSRVADASVPEVLRMSRDNEGSCRRIGVTGPPGVGKSTLIARLARNRLRHPGPLGIIAIDPTSPISGGAILGDRIRMQDLAGDARVFIRSFASRASHDGLTDNLPDILAVFDDAGFSELIVETVGVGQVGYAVRCMVDSNVLVTMPGSGDQIQAMKGGTLETADICVVNKSDLPGARQLAAELRAVVDPHARGPRDWVPPVILASAVDPAGIDELGEAIDRHQAWLDDNDRRSVAMIDRRAHHVSSLVARRITEIMHSLPHDVMCQSLATVYRVVVSELAGSCGSVPKSRDQNVLTSAQP